MQEPKQNGIVAYCFGSYMSFMRRQYELMGKRLPRAVTWRAMGYFVVVEAVLVALRFPPPTWWLSDFIDQFYLVYYIVLPIFLIWGVDQYKTDDKSLFSYVRSCMTFTIRNHRRSRLASVPKLTKHVVRGTTHFIQYQPEDVQNAQQIDQKNKDIHAYSVTFLNQEEECKNVEKYETQSAETH
jgi:hypothetical protein